MLTPAALALSLLVSAEAPAASPADFADEVKLLYQVVTCQEGALPEHLDAKAVEAYCAKQRPRFERFREHWGTPAKQFLGQLEPAGVPSELIYPFGGGDLMMALTAFPEATLITTLSLELAGDPRRIKTLEDKAALKQSLAGIADASGSTLVSNDSKSVNMSLIQRGELPGQLSMHLMGLMLAGQVPVSVRYFRLEEDGALHYFTQAEIDAQEDKKAERLRETWKSPDFSPAFANVEVQFVPKDQPDAPRRVHRHIAADLSDAGLKKSPGVLRYLQSRGRVSMMTKAASYLLWGDNFVTLRSWIVENAAFMFADSTGVPPRWWKKAGCSVETFGSFQKSFLETWEGYQKELRDEYAAQPFRALPMRYGYPDGSPERRSHLIVARCDRSPDGGVLAPAPPAPPNRQPRR